LSHPVLCPFSVLLPEREVRRRNLPFVPKGANQFLIVMNAMNPKEPLLFRNAMGEETGTPLS
jgi:hypothetical protein